MRTLVVAIALSAITCAPSPAAAQAGPSREKARLEYRVGMDHMRAEAWAQAARSFQQAIDLDPQFDFAYYWLGRANMNQKKYIEAIAAYTKCRDLYLAQAGRQFSNAQEAQRYRNDRLTEIDEQLRMVRSGPQTPQAQDQLRQLENTRRDMQDRIQRGSNMSIDATVPAWVSLSLGSAYFRSGKLADAEREYKAAIAVDSKAGEAHSNLAVVYLETGRLVDAERSLAAARKAGFKVNPQLEQDIKDRKRGSS